jgi:hypothetical protein
VHSVERIHEEDDVGCLRDDATAVCCQRDSTSADEALARR